MATAMREERVFPLRKRGVNWGWVWALLVYWVYKIGITGAMLLIYVGFIADGLRRWKSPFGQKVWRFPMLNWLRDFEATYRLDYAMVGAIVMAFVVCIAWSYLLRTWVEGEELRSSMKKQRMAGAALIVGSAILIGDALLFYMTCVQAGWSGTKFSISALIGTAVYVAVVIMVNLIGVDLKFKVEESRNR